MSEQHHGNLLGGAIGETTQAAAQLATIAATAAQTLARMRARALEADRARDQAAINAGQVRRVGERLGALHPDLIVRYQQRVADGMGPVDAMVEAPVALSQSTGDLHDAAAARAIAVDERGQALQNSAVPDIAATISVDEHSQGVHAGANHATASDAASARAALLAAQAYPASIRVSPPQAPNRAPMKSGIQRDVRYRRRG